jgi:predicted metalloprotease with PDZ domain
LLAVLVGGAGGGTACTPMTTSTPRAGVGRGQLQPPAKPPVPNPPPGVRYALHYRIGAPGQSPVLVVDMHFVGDASGRTALFLPGRWAFVPDFSKWVRNLRVLTPGSTVRPGPKPYYRLVLHPPGAQLHLQYEVVTRAPVIALGQRNRYYHLFRRAGFRFVGHAIFAIPAWPAMTRRPVELRWVTASPPRKWTLANSFGAGQAVQRFSASLFELRHAIYLGGDYRVLRREVRGRPVVLAIRGRWKFSDTELAALVAKTVGLQRAFWRDDRFPYFLVAATPLPGPCCAYGGLGFTNSVALFLNTTEGVGPELRWLMAHELFHAWLGDRIRPAHLDQRHRWFFEGVTEYFAHLLILRHFNRSLPTYVAELNQKIRAYWRSSQRAATLRQMLGGLWKSTDLYRLAYWRGHLLASNWHAAHHRATRGREGLGGLMRRLYTHVRKSGKRFTVDMLSALTRRQNPGWIGRTVRKHIVGGQLLRPDPRGLGPCVTLKLRTIYAFDLGFDWPQTQRRRRLSGVRAGGPASKAGLKPGEKVWGWKLRMNDPDFAVQLYVRRRGRLRWVRFLPRRGLGWTVPQYQVDAKRFKTTPAACLSWFGVPPSPKWVN